LLEIRLEQINTKKQALADKLSHLINEYEQKYPGIRKTLPSERELVELLINRRSDDVIQQNKSLNNPDPNFSFKALKGFLTRVYNNVVDESKGNLPIRSDILDIFHKNNDSENSLYFHYVIYVVPIFYY